MGAETFDVESAREQNVAENTDTDTADFAPVPEKRKKRARRVSLIICTITAILVIIFCIVNRNAVEYYPGPTQKNTTNVCYIKEKKLTFSGLFTTALGLFGVVLGTLVDRLTLIVEEHHHLHQRYGGSRKKMIKACFSGIVKGPVIALLGLAAVIVVILIFVTGKPWLELSYLVYIFSGIGVGPLIMHLLNLNTQSEVHISTILEEKETYIANGLAWSYYFNYLSKALPKFQAKFPDNIRNSVHQDQGTHVRLSLNKLILLISHDCETEDNLEKQDNKIKKENEIQDGVYRFPVYRLEYNGSVHRYVIKYVKQPLETLDKMSKYERIKALQEKQRECQVKLLYRTLSEIVKNPLHVNCKEKCILVPIKAKSTRSLNNGMLVNAIMHKVKADESTLERVDGFMKVPSTRKTGQPKATEDEFVKVPSTRKTGQPKVTEDGFVKVPSTRKTGQPKATEDDTSLLVGKTVDLPPSHKMTINPREGRAQYSKQAPIDNQDENTLLVYPKEEQANTLERSEEPVNVQLQRKYKGKSSRRELHNNYKTSIRVDVHAKQDRECKGTQTISMLSKGQAEMDDPKESGGIGDQLMSTNLVDGEEYGRRPAMSDGQPISGHTAETGIHPTSGNPKNGGGNSPREDSLPVFNRTGETENQRMSSDFMDEGENCLREEVDNGRPAPIENQNQPMSSHLMDDGENSPGGEEEDKGSMSSTSMNGGVLL